MPAAPSTHNLRFRYTHGSQDPATLFLYTNDAPRKTVEFPPVSAPGVWETVDVPIGLSPGQTVVRLQQDEGTTGGVSIDSLIVSAL